MDKNPDGSGKIKYRLKQINNDGQFEYSNEISVKYLLNEFELYQNYSNSFNSNTTISWKSAMINKMTLLK